MYYIYTIIMSQTDDYVLITINKEDNYTTYDYDNCINLKEEINYCLMHKLLTDSSLEDEDKIELYNYRKNFEDLNNTPPYVNICYVQKLNNNKKPFGRMIPKNNNKCLTFLSKNLRNLLIKDIYLDIDIENCAPTILYNLCLINNIESPILTNYIKTRKDKINQLKTELSLDDESKIKQIIFELTYGGNDTRDNLFLNNYKEEIKQITNNLKQIKNYQEYLNYIIDNNEIIENIDGKFLSSLIYDFENKILMVAYNYFIRNNYQVGTLEFDGLKIKKIKNNKNINDILKNINDLVFQKYNFTIKFINKPLSIDKKYKDILKNLNKHYIIYNDVEGSHIMNSLYKNNFIFTQPRVCYMNIENIWQERKEKENILTSLITFTSNQNIKQFQKEIEDENTHEKKIICKTYSRNTNGANNISKFWYSLLSHNCYMNKNFNELMYNSTLGKICFDDGVYDFKKKIFTPWKLCNDVFSPYKMKIKYKDVLNVNNEDVKRVKDKIIAACLKPDIVDYFLHRLSRSIAGYISDKKWCVLLGFRNSGKGVIIEMLKESFGNDYVKNMNSGNLSIKNSSGDTAKLQSWMCDLEFSRIVYSNEVSVEKNKLDGNTIKLIASGGDAVTARRNHENERTFKTQYTYYLCCNDLPDIVPSDANQTRELYDFPWQFKNKNEIESNNSKKCKCQTTICNCNNSQWKNNYKLADNEIKSEFCQNNTNKFAFIKLILDSFVDEMPYNETITDDNNSYQNEDSNDGEELLLEHFIINTANKNFKISDKEIDMEINNMKEIHQNKLKITKAKIIKILKRSGAKRLLKDNIFKGYQFVKLASKCKGLNKKNINNDSSESDSYSDSESDTN